MPSHSHDINLHAASGSALSINFQDLGDARSTPGYIGDTGGGGSHNNMPAYQTLYAWRRTA